MGLETPARCRIIDRWTCAHTTTLWRRDGSQIPLRAGVMVKGPYLAPLAQRSVRGLGREPQRGAGRSPAKPKIRRIIQHFNANRNPYMIQPHYSARINPHAYTQLHDMDHKSLNLNTRTNPNGIPVCGRRASELPEQRQTEPNARTQQKYRSSYGSLGAVSGWHRSIHVDQPPQEPCGGAERIWQMSQHRRGLPGRRS